MKEAGRPPHISFQSLWSLVNTHPYLTTVSILDNLNKRDSGVRNSGPSWELGLSSITSIRIGRWNQEIQHTIVTPKSLSSHLAPAATLIPYRQGLEYSSLGKYTCPRDKTDRYCQGNWGSLRKMLGSLSTQTPGKLYLISLSYITHRTYRWPLSGLRSWEVEKNPKCERNQNM